MKKQFLNLGKALNKAEQKSINGGLFPIPAGGCPPGYFEESCGRFCVAPGETFLAPC